MNLVITAAVQAIVQTSTLTEEDRISARTYHAPSMRSRLEYLIRKFPPGYVVTSKELSQ